MMRAVRASALCGTALFLAGCGEMPGGHGTGPGQGHGQTVTVKILSSENVVEKVDGQEATTTTLEVTIEPGGGSPPHRHPGPVFGHVLEGEFETQLGDAPARRLKAGDTFYEPTMILHALSRNPSDKNRTRVLAIMVHPRDAKGLVIPEPPQQGE
jgi:quercetin dioxygenase-like cupin family protein